MYLSASCLILGPVLEMILPNVPLLNVVSGAPSRTLLVTLKASARNSI
jgi:hypothetical protein